MSFVHLHVHSEYSWLDGACTIEDLVQRAVELRMPAVAITDRNCIAGSFQLWRQCRKAGIKPIVGLEIEVINEPGDGKEYSVILLAKNSSGYANLCRLLNLAYDHDSLSPRVSKRQLKDHASDLICLSFSVVGELCTLLLEDKDEEARQVSDWYWETFGEDYYYEIQNHGLPKEAIAMSKLQNLAQQTSIPMVLTNDCHYLEHKDSIAIDALNCIRMGIDFSHPDAKRFACNEYYFKSTEDMMSLCSDPNQLINNSLVIASKIDENCTFLPDNETNTEAELVVNVLRKYSSSLRISYDPMNQHIWVALMGTEVEGVKKRFAKKLPDFRLISGTMYLAWTPAEILAAVLKVMAVPDSRIMEYCSLISPDRYWVRKQVWRSGELQSLESSDNVLSRAVDICHCLAKTFREFRSSNNLYALLPQNVPVPLMTDKYGNTCCQFDIEHLRRSVWISLAFRARGSLAEASEDQI